MRTFFSPQLPLSPREQEIFEQAYLGLAKKTDLMFAILFGLQWILALVFAFTFAPQTWSGVEGSIHPHVWAAIFIGGLLAIFPIYLNLSQPGQELNRIVVAIAQIGFSILFIHLTGGRIETHFHIFGSLAFLSAYRDFRLILIATAITALDHIFRGAFWPESVYGVLIASSWRAFEHAAWVVFEDVFLLVAIDVGINEKRAIACKQYELERTVANIETQVRERTRDLSNSRATILTQQHALLAAAKMSALGEMAAGIAHEVNNPIAIIKNLTSQMTEVLGESPLQTAVLSEMSLTAEKAADRVATIVSKLKLFAGDASDGKNSILDIADLVRQIVIANTEFAHKKKVPVHFELGFANETIAVFGRAQEISQVVLNLLQNAIEAAETAQEHWVRVEIGRNGQQIEIRMIDSGAGVDRDLREKIFQPFFTTKSIGQGVGLGLSLAQGIAKSYGGTIEVEDHHLYRSSFLLTLPIAETAKQSEAI